MEKAPAKIFVRTPAKTLPEPTLRRLPWYLAYVSILASQGVEHVSSTAIARKLNVDASQIAKDLSFLSLKGKTRIGYHVASLEHELEEFLGFKRGHNAVIVGVGSLGSALISDDGLHRYGLNIVAGFDINPSVVGTTIGHVPIFPVEDLKSLREAYNAEIGIVTVPVENAQQVADSLIEAGVKALWNFTPYRIRTESGIVVTNTSIYAHLALMYNRIDSLPAQ